MNDARITKVAEVVDKLGGRNAVAARYGVTYTAVSNWISWNRFPARLHFRIARDCEAAKIRLDDDLLAVGAA